jgi:hypothetical protein
MVLSDYVVMVFAMRQNNIFNALEWLRILMFFSKIGSKDTTQYLETGNLHCSSQKYVSSAWSVYVFFYVIYADSLSLFSSIIGG